MLEYIIENQYLKIKACFAPLFIFMVLCMFITASTELGTGQLIGNLLQDTGVAPILVLVYINGLMMIGRLNAEIGRAHV